MLQIFSCQFNTKTATTSYDELSQNIFDDTLLSRTHIAPQTLSALMLLEHAMAHAFPKLPRPLRVQRAPQGKPFFTDYPNIHFNLSHSAGQIVCAISDLPVGIDIQQEIPRKLTIANRFFHAREVEFLSTLDTRARQTAFYQLWVLKEAYLKAIGEGLHKPLSDFCISLVPAPCILVPAGSAFHLSLIPSSGFDTFHVGLCTTSTNPVPEIISLQL